MRASKFRQSPSVQSPEFRRRLDAARRLMALQPILGPLASLVRDRAEKIEESPACLPPSSTTKPAPGNRILRYPGGRGRHGSSITPAHRAGRKGPPTFPRLRSTLAPLAAPPLRSGTPPAQVNWRCPGVSPFDFSILEARLVLTQFPRNALPWDSPHSHLDPHLPRILLDRGLTNGVGALKIDCMHVANHAGCSSWSAQFAWAGRRSGQGWGGWRGAGPSSRDDQRLGLARPRPGCRVRRSDPNRGWEAIVVRVRTRGCEVGLGRQLDRGSHPVGGAGLDGSGSRGVAGRWCPPQVY